MLFLKRSKTKQILFVFGNALGISGAVAQSGDPFLLELSQKDSKEIVENIAFLYPEENSKIDINQADKEELLSIAGVSTHVIEKIWWHREQYGAFLSLYELQSIKEIEPYLPEILPRLQKIEPQKNHLFKSNIQAYADVKSTQNDTIEETVHQYRINQQLGEFKVALKYQPDVFSGYAQYYFKNIKTQVLAGNFRLQYGQGLTASNSYIPGFSKDIYSLMPRLQGARGVCTHVSLSAFQGVYAKYQHQKTLGDAFYALYHRSYVQGASWGRQYRQYKVQGFFIQSKALHNTSQRVNLSAGMFHQWMSKNMLFQGELSSCLGAKSLALQEHLIWSMGKHSSFSMSYRYYPKAWIEERKKMNFLTDIQAQKTIGINWEHKPNSYTTYTLGAWHEKELMSPSEYYKTTASDVLWFKIQQVFRKRWDYWMSMEYKQTQAPFLSDIWTQSLMSKSLTLQGQIKTNESMKWQFKSGLYHQFFISEQKPSATMIYQEVQYKFPSRWSTFFQTTLFDSPDKNLWLREKNLSYQTSAMVLRGQGFRGAWGFYYKPLSTLQIQTKIAITKMTWSRKIDLEWSLGLRYHIS